ncbi:restriction endonuclease subunit S [Staphylococcus aureus]|uniref:restriction endonuclease subunit S n=1 Tax=Staphylococcus aureus TaxID=1280 RepID=UPI001C1E8642|nr:restriction endonuclease subunit S [Staphylococcus aureus]MBU6128701.1 restriction endonuclease subunit S [Staphylococcus aureus]
MSNTQKKNVPELRFQGFEGEWEEKKLEDLIKVNSGKDYKHLDKGDIPVYGTGGYMTSVSEPLSEIDAVGIGRKGTINKPYLLEAPFWTVDTLFYCTPKKETDILFILSLFRKINWKVYDESTGVPSLSKQTINKINRFVPTNKEQQKIGKFFSKLDRQIELEEQKLELLQQQKKGYMQKIFSQELRFKDENDKDYPDWEEENLGDLLIEVSDKTTTNNQYTLLSSTKNGLKSQEEYFKKQIASKDSTGYKILRLNQLVLSPQNLWLGNININQQFDFGIVSPSYKVYTLKNNFDIQFAKDLLKSPKYIYEYALASEQGASIVRRNLNLDLFHFIKVNLPDLVEQKKIGFFLSEVDASIEMQSLKLNLLNKRKKVLLQKVFL